jgi:hypothetical protein
MKKVALTLATLLMVVLPASAQWSIGLSGGYAYNYYNYDPQYMSGMDYTGHHGFAVDLPVDYQFNDWFGLSSGLSFQKKGYQMTGNYMNADSVLVQFYRNVCRDDYYLTLPILAKFQVPFGQTKLKLFFDAGGYAAYWIQSNYSSIETFSAMGYPCREQNYSKEFRDDVDRRIEIGIVGGLGIEYLLHPRCTVFCVTRCYFALTPQQKEYQIKHFPSRNTMVTGQVGFMYNFKQKKQ